MIPAPASKTGERQGTGPGTWAAADAGAAEEARRRQDEPETWDELVTSGARKRGTWNDPPGGRSELAEVPERGRRVPSKGDHEDQVLLREEAGREV